MSEYKTLDEIFPDGKPDGRKFEVKNSPFIVEPKFRSRDCVWWSINQNNDGCSYGPSYLYKEHVPPKQTKKVKMYTPVYKSTKASLDGHLVADCSWHQEKTNFQSGRELVGYMEMEVEVTE